MSSSSSCSSNSISVVNSIVGIREAFQTKERGNLGNGPNRGGRGRQKIKKVPSFSWEKFKIRGWGLWKSKKSQVPESTKE